jgi:outer membrane protein
MKNVSLGLNVVLIIAVGILYYLHFSAKNASVESPATAMPAIVREVKPSAIVFLNSDTLLDNYAYLKTKRTEIEAKHKKISSELEGESSRLQADAEAYRQHGSMMTDEQRQKTEEQLMMRQQQLVAKEKTLMSKLDEEQDAVNQELFKKLTAYLKEYNKGKNYQFILGYQKGGGILLANDSLDITKSVIQGLNKSYSDEAGSK